jgi:hypothetical protein
LELLEFPLVDQVYKKYISIYEKACGLETLMAYGQSSPSNFLSGSVSVIQERGMKGRIIANPLRVHQMALSKLGNFLFSVLRGLPWDCTFAQERGVRFVSDTLQSGKTVFCHDLSDATNNFPLDYSIMMLQAIGEILPLHDREWLMRHTELFTMVARGKWLAPAEMQDNSDHNLRNSRYIHWTVGQPLGLYPSFPLFALSHGFIIRSIEYRLGTSDTFRVLGDDVVINNSEVSERYLWVLKTLGVPRSEEKSLISDVLGEFAGKVISKKGPLRVEKWKDTSPLTYLEIIRWLGKPGLCLVPPALRKFCEAMMIMPQPLGLGFNPQGLAFDQRIPKGFEELVLRSFEDTTTLPNFKEDIRAERILGAEAAFAGRVYTAIGTSYGLPPNRQGSVDPVIFDHLNSLYEIYGRVPDPFVNEWKKIRDLTFRRTRYKVHEGIEVGRFFQLYSLWKRNRYRK